VPPFPLLIVGNEANGLGMRTVEVVVMEKEDVEFSEGF